MTPFINPDESFHTGAAKILEFIRAEGLKAEVKNGLLYVGPRAQISDDLRWLLTDYRPELTALVACQDEDVSWRAGSMLRQLARLNWPCPIPFLVALPGCEPKQEDCHSCGELLDVGEGNSYICGPCARAKSIALELWMARPSRAEKVA